MDPSVNSHATSRLARASGQVPRVSTLIIVGSWREEVSSVWVWRRVGPGDVVYAGRSGDLCLGKLYTMTAMGVKTTVALFQEWTMAHAGS